jgi:glucose/arabinose dehydrogenase
VLPVVCAPAGPTARNSAAVATAAVLIGMPFMMRLLDVRVTWVALPGDASAIQCTAGATESRRRGAPSYNRVQLSPQALYARAPRRTLNDSAGLTYPVETEWSFDMLVYEWGRRAVAMCAFTTLLVLPALAQEAPRSPTPRDSRLPARQVDVARGLEHPWGLAFLPDGRMLVTERPGRVRIVSPSGELSAPLAGVPKVRTGDQGGLLDIALSPTFAKDRLVYLSFSEPGGREGGAGTAVARGRLGERGLEDPQVIWRQQPKVGGAKHWGSRLLFRPDGTLFVTLGDRFLFSDHAQNLGDTLGKIVRINPDGSIPRDNPFVGRDGARPEIWSYGHRNVQAAVLDAQGRLWTVEHGARGGDELNQPEAGKNYGWPVITYGVDYSGAQIGVGTTRPGMEQPVYYWDPVIAPSGATFYTGDAFRDWKGDLLVGSLRPGRLVRLRLANGRVTQEERYVIAPGERIRDVRQGPDGLIYVLTDHSQGRIVRLEPTGP